MMMDRQLSTANIALVDIIAQVKKTSGNVEVLFISASLLYEFRKQKRTQKPGSPRVAWACCFQINTTWAYCIRKRPITVK